MVAVDDAKAEGKVMVRKRTLQEARAQEFVAYEALVDTGASSRLVSKHRCRKERLWKLQARIS
jgi:hypothetical protein